MSVTVLDSWLPESWRRPGIAVSEDEFLATFAEVMIEWGHHRTAHDLRFPTLGEARVAALGRRTDRGWNTSPFPVQAPDDVSGA